MSAFEPPDLEVKDPFQPVPMYPDPYQTIPMFEENISYDQCENIL